MTTEAETRETVWVTKHCLDCGIYEAELQQVRAGSYVAHLTRANHGCKGSWVEPGDYMSTREEAIAQADRMRTEEITRLRARIAELEAMNF